jgi:hypothetical protein
MYRSASLSFPDRPRRASRFAGARGCHLPATEHRPPDGSFGIAEKSVRDKTAETLCVMRRHLASQPFAPRVNRRAASERRRFLELQNHNEAGDFGASFANFVHDLGAFS